MPHFDDLPTGDPVHGNPRPFHLFSCRSDAVELTKMCPVKGHASHHFITFGNLILDRQMVTDADREERLPF
jgi:hypothetical protein